MIEAAGNSEDENRGENIMSKASKAAQNESSEREIRFQCVAPGAQSVFLVGAFNDWIPTATPMEVGQADDWQADEWHAVVKIPPGTYEYKYIVDGIWCCHPGVADENYVGEDAVPNAFGTKNRVIEVE